MPPTFSLRLAPPGSRRPHRLQEACRPVVRSASLRRTVDGLRAFLSAFETGGTGDRVRLDAVALVRDRSAVLLPERLRSRMASAEHTLRQRGLGIADGPCAVTLDGRHVVVESPSPPVTPRVRGLLETLAEEPAGPLPVAVPGRYRLAGWAWPRSGDGHPLRAAELVAAVARAVRNRDAVDPDRALAALAEAVTRQRRVPLPVGDVATAGALDTLEALW